MKNNSPDPQTMGFLLLFAGALMLAIFVFYFFVAVAAALAIASLWALFRPLRMGKITIYPSEARAYLKRSIIGMMASIPAAKVIAGIFSFTIEPSWTPHIVAAGFLIASLGVEVVKAQLGIECKEAIAEKAQAEAMARAVQTKPAQPIREERAQYEFANWHDEDEVDPYK